MNLIIDFLNDNRLSSFLNIQISIHGQIIIIWNVILLRAKMELLFYYSCPAIYYIYIFLHNFQSLIFPAVRIDF